MEKSPFTEDIASRRKLPDQSMEHPMSLEKSTCAAADASVSSNMVALEFYHAARDSLLLYLVIIPVKLEKQLKTVSQAAMLVYSDLLHLSQEALGLAFEYRAFAPSALRELMVFVDIAPNFQQLAAETLQKQIQLTDLNIKEALDGANGFQNTHQRQNFESAKFAIDQVVFVLEKVHILWEPVLIPAIYRRTLCSILDRVFSRINEDVLQLDDLGADETLQLQRLIYIILENLSALFESLRINKSEDRRSDSDVWFELENLIPSLCKLRKLADLLDMSLKLITAAWEDGSLASCGFSKLEVLDFVKAIFADSPNKRIELLNELKETICFKGFVALFIEYDQSMLLGLILDAKFPVTENGYSKQFIQLLISASAAWNISLVGGSRILKWPLGQIAIYYHEEMHEIVLCDLACVVPDIHKVITI
ncbi:Centromere/kinetochore zw10-like protein [Nymphaea thermarum]|nr:Centromere/kinetochore zw10-like protein [Nymphaea thermarum]